MDQRTDLEARREDVLDRIVDICLSAGPVAEQTDKYFTNTSRIVRAKGDSEVTFAEFMRRRVVAALEPTIRIIKRLAPGTRIKRFFNEGDLVPSEMKMLEITGSMADLSEIETLVNRQILLYARGALTTELAEAIAERLQILHAYLPARPDLGPMRCLDHASLGAAFTAMLKQQSTWHRTRRG